MVIIISVNDNDDETAGISKKELCVLVTIVVTIVIALALSLYSRYFPLRSVALTF